jgi:hypothetical protein
VDEDYGRGSTDKVQDANTAIDDGIWYRSVQRNRIVDEIITSEESYIRDLKTLLNVLYLGLILKAAKSLHRSILPFFHGIIMIVKPSNDQLQKYCNYTKSFSHIFMPFSPIMTTIPKSFRGTTV